MRAIRSPRGSRPKTVSSSSSEPAAAPSIDVMSNFMASFSLGLGRRRRLGVEAGPCPARSVFVQRLLDGVSDRDPTAGETRHRAFHQNQPARDVGLDHAKVLRRDLVSAHVAGHLLVFPGLARILTAAGRTVRAMRDRDALRRTQPAEISALHRTCKTLAERHASDIDILSNGEMLSGDLGPDGEQLVLG